MSRRKPVIDERIRLAWTGIIAVLSREELVALHYHVTQELRARNREKKKEKAA